MAFDYNKLDDEIQLQSKDDMRETHIIVKEQITDCFADKELNLDGTEFLRRQGCFRTDPKFYLKDPMTYLKYCSEAAHFGILYLEAYEDGQEFKHNFICNTEDKQDFPWIVFGQIVAKVDSERNTVIKDGTGMNFYIFLGIYNISPSEHKGYYKLSKIADAFWFDSSKKPLNNNPTWTNGFPK